MDLTFQVPMQYCSLQHWTWLPSPVTTTTGCCFCFGSIPYFFLELFLHWSPIAYWAPTCLGSSSFSILSFCPFKLFMYTHTLIQWEYYSTMRTEENPVAVCNSLNEAWGHYAKWNKAGRKRQVLYDMYFIYTSCKCNLKKPNQWKHNRMVVTRGWAVGEILVKGYNLPLWLTSFGDLMYSRVIIANNPSFHLW